MVNDDGGVVHTQTCIPAPNRFSEEPVCVSKSVGAHSSISLLFSSFLYLGGNRYLIKKCS